jgi:hypothetical protein
MGTLFMTDPAAAISTTSQTASVIRYIGAFVGLLGGGVALAGKCPLERVELANNYLRIKY